MRFHITSKAFNGIDAHYTLLPWLLAILAKKWSKFHNISMCSLTKSAVRERMSLEQNSQRQLSNCMNFYFFLSVSVICIVLFPYCNECNT
jgi:hypothetical protein